MPRLVRGILMSFLILNKADSDVAGARGNRERFYVLHIAKT